MLIGITLNDLVASNIWSSQVSWPHSQFIDLTVISFLGIPLKQRTRLPHKMRILIKAFNDWHSIHSGGVGYQKKLPHQGNELIN